MLMLHVGQINETKNTTSAYIVRVEADRSRG